MKSLLNEKVYELDAIELSKKLLGKYIVREYDKKKLVAKIVETEAYMGIEDKGSHSYNNKRTEKTEAMYLPPGYVYIYIIYGMYHCLNIVSKEVDNPQAVLIRAVEPIEGIDIMSMNRFGKEYEQLTTQQKKNITNGPGKLCKALNIDKSLNKVKLNIAGISIYDGDKDFEIVESKRINIDYAEEAKDYLWRFYINGNKYISKK